MPLHVHANRTALSEPFEENLPSEIYFEETSIENDKPSLRWAAPYENGDGTDQKIPLGELTFLNILGIAGLCVIYSVRKKHTKGSNV